MIYYSQKLICDRCDVYLHAVDSEIQAIASVFSVLQEIHSQYKLLRSYAIFSNGNSESEKFFIQGSSPNIALATMIALFLVIFVGTIINVTVYYFLKKGIDIDPNHWYKKKNSIEKRIIDEINTTENPLWIEQ